MSPTWLSIDVPDVLLLPKFTLLHFSYNIAEHERIRDLLQDVENLKENLPSTRVAWEPPAARTEPGKSVVATTAPDLPQTSQDGTFQNHQVKAFLRWLLKRNRGRDNRPHV